MLIIGHRGAAGTEPENTLRAIDFAMTSGVDWIEIDVRSVDEEIIVIHDATLARTTNGVGSVYAYSVDELRRLDAGKGEKIPLLGEVLDRIDGRVALNIEIKQRHLIEPLLTVTDQYLANQRAWHNRIMLSSFLPEVMHELGERSPSGYLLAALSEHDAAQSLHLAQQINAYSLNIALEQLREATVTQAHVLDLRVFVYTVNEFEDIARCKKLGIDAIFTDYPARAIAFLNE